MKRSAKTITNPNDIKFLIGLDQDDIKDSLIYDIFGEFNGKSRFQPFDIIQIPKGSYGPEGKKNINDFTTTVGIWIFNKFFIEKELFDMFKYINKTVNKKLFNQINDQLSYALLEDRITLDQLKHYLEKTQKFMPYVSILSPALSSYMMNISKVIDKKKNQLIKENKEALDNGDAKVMEKIEKELLDYAKELLKDDPAYDVYESGARSSFGNNFKNMFVCKGAAKDPDPNKGYNIITSNYMEGISKEDYPKVANSLAEGPYYRSNKTSKGGYWEKLFISAFQHLVLLPDGSDCGTKRYITVYLTKDNIKDYMYSYIIEGNRLVELNSQNMDKYINKTVKMRFSSMCEAKDGFCSKCAGSLYYKLGIKNIGTAMAIMPSTLKNLAMKSFHDSVVTTTQIDPMKVFGLK